VPSTHSWRDRALRWAAELLLVFLGAYSAFWLTNHQEHKQEALRHQQILAELEQQATADLAAAKTERERQAKISADFQRALAAGEMPSFTTPRPNNFGTGLADTQLPSRRSPPSLTTTSKPRPIS
jgi:hypothetical protein